MYVNCKSCNYKIPVTGKPKGSTSLSNVQLTGNVRVGDAGISFGKGGIISFKKGGRIGFGAPRPSTFVCPECGASAEYGASEILDN